MRLLKGDGVANDKEPGTAVKTVAGAIAILMIIMVTGSVAGAGFMFGFEIAGRLLDETGG